MDNGDYSEPTYSDDDDKQEPDAAGYNSTTSEDDDKFDPCYDRRDEGVDEHLVEIRRKYRLYTAPEPDEPGYELLQQDRMVELKYYEGSPPLLALEAMCEENQLGIPDQLEECYEIASTIEAACVRRYLSRRGDFERWVYLTLCNETECDSIADPESEERDICPNCDTHVIELKHICHCHPNKWGHLWAYYDEGMTPEEGWEIPHPASELEQYIETVYRGTKHEE